MSYVNDRTHHYNKLWLISANNIDSLTPSFWVEKRKCHELNQVMHQSDK